MAQMGRPGLSSTQKKELWRRWKKGESLSEIGRALGKHAGSIHGVVKANGGIVPGARTRSTRMLSVSEREEISRGLAPSRIHPLHRGPTQARTMRHIAAPRACVRAPDREYRATLGSVASSVLDVSRGRVAACPASGAVHAVPGPRVQPPRVRRSPAAGREPEARSRAVQGGRRASRGGHPERARR